jgi:hypothetical protein
VSWFAALVALVAAPAVLMPATAISAESARVESLLFMYVSFRIDVLPAGPVSGVVPCHAVLLGCQCREGAIAPALRAH